MVALEQVSPPAFSLPDEPPLVPAAEYELRGSGLRDRVEADVVVVYADREHFANLSFLCGIDPRFEEALLVLAGGAPSLLLGTEGLSLAALVPIDVEVVHCPSLGLMGQDRTPGFGLVDGLREAGIRPGMRAALVGWKYFEPDEWQLEATPFAVPAFVVEAVRGVVGTGGELVDATEALMNPRDGLRAVASADQIAAFEWAAVRASVAVAAIVRAAAPGVSELDAVAAMGYAGDPLSAHVMFASGPEVAVGLRSPTGRRLERGDAATAAVGFRGGLCCRAGLVEGAEAAGQGHAAEYLQRLAVPYWQAIRTWWESIALGAPGGEVDRTIRRLLADAEFGPALNPGHLVHLDEWVHTPVRPGSDDPIRSGMCFQCDIIPDNTRPGWAANCEDTLAVADAELRAELAGRHPGVWKRIESRRAFMRDELGIAIADEVLPLSAAPACFPPLWLSPDQVLVAR